MCLKSTLIAVVEALNTFFFPAAVLRRRSENGISFLFLFFPGMIEHTVSDGAAHDGLLLLAAAPGLSGCRLDVAPAPSHPQLQGEVVARQHGDDGIRYHGNVVGPVEGEDQRGIRRGKCGQSRGPISSRRRRWKEVNFTPDSSWWRSQRGLHLSA